MLAALVTAAGTAGATSGDGPVPTVVPTLIGTAAAGKLLTGLSGSWAGFGNIAYHFQWYRCDAAGAACLSVHGATSPSYLLGDKDVGQTLGLTVRATDSTGTTSAYTSLIGPIAPRLPLLEATASPVVTGPPVVGKTIQVTTGTWSPIPTSLSYRWERCNRNGRACAAIPGASSSSYTAGSADLGHALLAIVQASNGTTTQNAFSSATPAIVDGSVRGPKETIGPVVSGPAIVGQQLAAATGIWRGVGSIAFGYRWYRCDGSGGHCSLARTSASSTYRLTPQDTGDTLAVTLQATDSTGTTVAYTSLVGPVASADAPLTPTALPTISGTARVGGTLSLVDGSWTALPTRYATAWLRCNRNGRVCAPITGARGSTYRPTKADAGHALVGVVTATAGTATQAALTAATAPIT